ncbi:hypothetical protein TCON_1130 [Astathelohania contejeani]|uniref:Uncharacterized protein n=1 Tax=Astathelohania contejeani TaxID=164912 RepID=A0ABQ7HZZ5_9MICR|nr:hypothetical protein TCON_1130 [Thelohania contejeani]
MDPLKENNNIGDTINRDDVNSGYELDSISEYDSLSDISLYESNSSDLKTEDEDEFFNKNTLEIGDYENEEPAIWNDAEEEELKLRKEFNLINDPVDWVTKQPKSFNLKRNMREFRYKIIKRIFSTKTNIKLIRCFLNRIIIIDNLNIIYLLEGDDDLMNGTYKAYKIEYLNVSDFIFLNKDVILLIGKNYNVIKEFNLATGKLIGIFRATGESCYNKIDSYDEFIFLMGDYLTVLDSKTYEIKSKIEIPIKDFTINKEKNNEDITIFVLGKDNSIYKFNLEGKIQYKLALEDRFEFSKLFYYKSKLIISTKRGLKFYDENMNFIKEFMNLNTNVMKLVGTNNIISHVSEGKNTLRFLDINNLKYFDNFPLSGVIMPYIKDIMFCDDRLYYCHKKYVSYIKMKYK